jgi:hypothetical protein
MQEHIMKSIRMVVEQGGHLVDNFGCEIDTRLRKGSSPLICIYVHCGDRHVQLDNGILKTEQDCLESFTFSERYQCCRGLLNVHKCGVT